MKAGGAALAIATVALASCGLSDGDYFGKVPKNPDPKHFRWCNSGEPEWVDPAMSTSTTGTPLARMMFAGLADFGDDSWGSAVPSIAESWEAAEDLRTFTFDLRDDAVWSNGRPLTSADFVYHVSRILHPTTLSRNTEPLTKIKNGELYTEGRVKMLTADSPPFSKGDIVEVVGVGGEVAEEPSKAVIPDSNERASTVVLKLRDLGAPESDAYATVPPGTKVPIIELSPDRQWAYVFYMAPMFEWRYGWVPTAELDIQPNKDVELTVRELPPEHRLGVSLPVDPNFVGKTAKVRAEHLLMLPEVLGVRAPEPHTFIVETWAPFPYLIDDVSGRTFRPTPRESVSRMPQKWTQPRYGLLVTSGAFTMTEWKVRDKMEFTRSETYFDKDNVAIERFTAYSIDDQAASSNLFYQGECDAAAANNVPHSYIPMLNGDKRGGRAYKDFKTVPYDGIYYYTINTDKMPNRHLRRALSLAIDRSPFPAILHGGETPVASFVPGVPIAELSDEDLALCGVTRDNPGVARIVTPGKLCYVPPLGLRFDPEEAKKEFELAKKEMGGKFPSSLEVIFNLGSEGHKIVAEYVQQEWKKNLGITISLSTMEWKTYLEETNQGNFQIARMGWIGGGAHPEGQFHLVFACGSPYNRARWCSEDYDRLYKEAQSTLDQKARLKKLEEAEKILLEDAPLIPLYVYSQKLLARPYVKDLYINMGSNPPMHRVRIDPDWKAKKEASR